MDKISYRCGINMQVTFRSDKELTDEEIIAEAELRLPNIKKVYHISRGKYKEKYYKLTKYDIDYLNSYKKSKSSISLIDMMGRYVRKVSVYSEITAGRSQFIALLEKRFKTEYRNTLQSNGRRTKRKFIYCELK